MEQEKDKGTFLGTVHLFHYLLPDHISFVKDELETKKVILYWSVPAEKWNIILSYLWK